MDDTRGGNAVAELEKHQGKRPQQVTDMRRIFDDKEVDGAIIATPEHWQALATIWACWARKDNNTITYANFRSYDNPNMELTEIKVRQCIFFGSQRIEIHNGKWLQNGTKGL